MTPRSKNQKNAKELEDKDLMGFEDDKSCISNVSTAISDRHKNFDDEAISFKD